jgi:hypothetical protein
MDVRAVDGLGHHIVPISVPAITFYSDIWKTMCAETTLTQWMDLEKKFHQFNHCKHSEQSCCQFSILTMSGSQWFTYWKRFPLTNCSPKSALLMNIKFLPVH